MLNLKNINGGTSGLNFKTGPDLTGYCALYINKTNNQNDDMSGYLSYLVGQHSVLTISNYSNYIVYDCPSGSFVDIGNAVVYDPFYESSNLITVVSQSAAPFNTDRYVEILIEPALFSELIQPGNTERRWNISMDYNSPPVNDMVFVNHYYERAILDPNQIGINPFRTVYNNIKLKTKPYELITDGLVFYFDASDWSGIGDWYSRVGNYTGSLTNTNNTITKELNNGGVIQSTGEIAYNGFQILNSNFANGDYTVITSTKYLEGGPAERIVSATGNNWLLGNWGGSINQYYAGGWVNGPYGYSNNNWNIHAGTRNGNNYKLYNAANLIVSNIGGHYGPINLGVFNHQYGNETSYGQCGFVLLYNRELTQEEIATNYNVLKGRFGL